MSDVDEPASSGRACGASLQNTLAADGRGTAVRAPDVPLVTGSWQSHGTIPFSIGGSAGQRFAFCLPLTPVRHEPLLMPLNRPAGLQHAATRR
jgi:hypothetical protein